MEHDNGDDALLCKWTVENITFALDDKTLSSPMFSVANNKMGGCLNVRLNSNIFENGLFCYLQCEENLNELTISLKLNYEISILAGDGSYKRIAQGINVEYFSLTDGNEGIFDTGFVYGRDLKGLLKESSTLTICCRIWNIGIFDPMQWFFRTRIETQKLTFKMSVHQDTDHFSKELTISSSEVFHLDMDFRWTEDITEEQTLQIQIKPCAFNAQKQLTCTVSVLDSVGDPAVFKKCKFYPMKENWDTWNFPPFISRKWLSDNADRFLINDTLNLWFEIEISNGKAVNEIERIHFGESSTLFAQEMGYDDPTATSSLMSGLLNLYQEQRFCDVTIKTGSSSFPAHKAILSAQSPVFAAMFEQDMKEKETAVVQIHDLTDDMVQQMLIFMYTSKVENLEWEDASELYLAADQYGIISLQIECKKILKAKVSVENVTEALLLADFHHEKDWELDLHDFIIERDCEIIDSSTWKKFMQDHTKLAAETMRLIYLQKLKKCNKTCDRFHFH